MPHKPKDGTSEEQVGAPPQSLAWRLPSACPTPPAGLDPTPLPFSPASQSHPTPGSAPPHFPWLRLRPGSLPGPGGRHSQGSSGGRLAPSGTHPAVLSSTPTVPVCA